MPPPGFRRLSEDKAARVRGEWENPFDAPYYRALAATHAYRQLEIHVVPRVLYALLGALVAGALTHFGPLLLPILKWAWLALAALAFVALLWLQYVILGRRRNASSVMQDVEREFTVVPDDYLDAQPGKMLGTQEERAAKMRAEINARTAEATAPPVSKPA